MAGSAAAIPSGCCPASSTPSPFFPEFALPSLHDPFSGLIWALAPVVSQCALRGKRLRPYVVPPVAGMRLALASDMLWVAGLPACRPSRPEQENGYQK